MKMFLVSALGVFVLVAVLIYSGAARERVERVLFGVQKNPKAASQSAASTPISDAAATARQAIKGAWRNTSGKMKAAAAQDDGRLSAQQFKAQPATESGS